MSTINDGGSIAANIDRLADGSLVSVGDLPIRDWFAGMALPGIFGYMQELGVAEQITGMERAEGAAFMAYHYADAMLAARERKEELQ